MLSGQPGTYIIQAGQAVMEIKCQEVVVEVRETPKCHDHLPIVAPGEDEFKYMDLSQNILVQLFIVSLSLFKLVFLDSAEAV